MEIISIKKFMKERNITQVELSKRSGIPLDTIKQILRGRTKNPRLDTMNAICNALGLPLELPTQPTIIDENSLAHYRTSRKNMIVIYDNSGDEYRLDFDKKEFEYIYDICKAVTRKNNKDIE